VADLSILGSLAANVVWFGGHTEVIVMGVAMLAMFSLGAVLLMQVTALLGGLIGWVAGLFTRLVRGARSIRPRAWAYFGVRSGLAAGFPLGVLAIWCFFASLTAVYSRINPSGQVLMYWAVGIGMAGPLLGSVLGLAVALRRGHWLRRLASGAFIGSLIGLIPACLLFTTAMNLDRTESAPDRLTGLNFSPDGRQMVSGTPNGRVMLWDAATGKSIWKEHGHPGSYVSQTVFSHDGKRVASVAVDGSVRVWEAHSGRGVVTLSGRPLLRELVFSPDGKRLAGRYIDGLIQVWDVQTGQEVHSLTIERDRLSLRAFSPDGKRLVSFGEEGMQVRSDFWGR
jgi:hypothetical protein